MINPFLQRRLNLFPVQPVLIETDPSALDAVMGLDLIRRAANPSSSLFQATGPPGVRAVIRPFSMFSLLGVPSKLIPVINALPGVRAVHADLETRILTMPTAGITNQELWWPTSESRKVLEADLAFQQGWTGEGVKSAVIDTGIDPNHPQLTGSEWESVITLPFREIFDENGHGSHVSSTVGGHLQFSPSGVFAEGVSNSPILSIKALGRGIGTGFTSEIINAMALAMQRGASVVNMSLGSQECQGDCDTCPECRAVKMLTERGILVFVAAGNSGPDPNTINCPGCTPEAITVAAVDRDLNVADFSSRGGTLFVGKPDLAAPGVDIFSGTGRGSLVDSGAIEEGFGYAAISGTSMATPHVAGLGALVKHRNPGITTAQFKERVRASGTSFNEGTGYGVAKWSWFG